MASEECKQACLYGSGMSQVYPSIKRARIQKTLDYLADARSFMARIERDIDRLIHWAKVDGLTPCVRINGTSDQPKLAMAMARRFPDIQFYDYTKIPAPWKRTLPNYHLTFSHSGTNLTDCIDALSHGINVAVVFHGALPETWHGYKVVNGDESDVRFMDPKGVVVGLTAKGPAKQMQSGGFIQIGLQRA
jgi:hypothetical protein